VVFERLGSFAEMWIFNLILGLSLLYEAEESHGQAWLGPSRPRALIDLTTSTAWSMRTGERAPGTSPEPEQLAPPPEGSKVVNQYGNFAVGLRPPHRSYSGRAGRFVQGHGRGKEAP